MIGTRRAGGGWDERWDGRDDGGAAPRDARLAWAGRHPYVLYPVGRMSWGRGCLVQEYERWLHELEGKALSDQGTAS